MARPNAHFSKFVPHRSTDVYELVEGMSKPMILVPLFYLKFLNRIRDQSRRNFK